ncbi:MAG: DUF4184 family protein [Chitinophaga sp.]|uniref:DUF4184 family protein n=1 Tax=Chitinophaga sp. TaxID=1869181 RepID=UPI0025BA4FE7|nr:DUF4184 family protein [Chitinophaga sp.]MBV8255294.1 DUF4184 family protein [Chitinophaga sp.]
MPFTISHAAVASPFYRTDRRSLSLSGLIIGSMVPDFLYFFRLNPYADDGHHLLGIFLYDIPLALLLAYAWHHWWRYPVMKYAPPFAAARLQRYQYFNWHRYFTRHYKVVLKSVLLGIATHLLLDAFTHQAGFFVMLSPSLQGNWGKMPAWYWMQILTSVAGLIILFYYFFKIPIKRKRKQTATSRSTLIFWGGTALISFLILLVNEHYHYIACKGLDYLATILGGVMYGFIVMAALMRIKTHPPVKK